MPRRRTTIALRWSDMDAYGHVNNVVYLRLFEDARIVAFGAHGTDDGGAVTGGTGLVVARHEIEYLRPLHYRPAPVAIDLWVWNVGGASFDVGYEVLEDDDPRRVYARASSRMVVYDLEADRPRRLSADERTRLQAFEDSPVRWRHRT